MLGDGDNERDLGLDGLLDGTHCLVGGHVDGGGIRPELVDSLASLSAPVDQRDRRGQLTWRAVGRTGRPRCWPVQPGLTPPTMLVPHAMESLAFAVAL